MKRFTPEEKYKYNLRKQRKKLEEFVNNETLYAEYLMGWYKANGKDMPLDQYRGCAFFINREYHNKPGSLTLVFEMYNRCMDELPSVTRETAFDLLSYRFKMYAEVLKTGGYNGQSNW